jgi:hypothetical protein
MDFLSRVLFIRLKAADADVSETGVKAIIVLPTGTSRGTSIISRLSPVSLQEPVEKPWGFGTGPMVIVCLVILTIA